MNRPSTSVSKQLIARAGALFVLAVSAASPLSAQDDFFGNLDIAIATPETSSSDSPIALLGWFSEKVAYGFQEPDARFARDKSGFTRIESSLFTQLDWQLGEGIDFRLSGSAYRDKSYDYEDAFVYSSDEINEMRTRFELRDFYIESAMGDWYVKFGNQVVAWGVSENLRIGDLVNTQNQYTFGQQDIEDLRLQATALLVSYPAGEWNLDAVIAYDAGVHDMARSGDEFDQLIRFRDPALVIQEAEAANKNEFFLRASTHYSNGDFSLVAADVNQNEYSVERIDALSDSSYEVILGQDRMQAVAAYTSWATGSWLLFGETGLHFNKALTLADPIAHHATNRFGIVEKNQWLTALGAEYNGFRNLTLTFEADQVHTRDHDARLLADRNEFGFSARMLWNTFNDRLQLLTVFNRLPGDQGDALRVSADYDWSDNLELGLLLVTYEAEPGTRLYDYRHNDIFQLQFTYSFQR